MSDDDIHSCGPTCSRTGCVEVRQRAHALVVKHGTHSGAVYETLYAVQHGDLDLEEASRVIDAICDARVADMHVCSLTCSREACAKARQDAHHYVFEYGSRDAVLAVLGAVKRGERTIEDAAQVFWAICDARVGGMAADQALVVRAMRDGRSTIHWRADETAATALIRERDQLAAKVEELHARLREAGR
jgi:hypothetical protein